jgi:hypothetical protein
METFWFRFFLVVMPLLFLVFNCVYWLSFGGHLIWALLEGNPIQANSFGLENICLHTLYFFISFFLFLRSAKGGKSSQYLFLTFAKCLYKLQDHSASQ